MNSEIVITPSFVVLVSKVTLQRVLKVNRLYIVVIVVVDTGHPGVSLSEQYNITWMGNSRYTLNRSGESVVVQCSV